MKCSDKEWQHCNKEKMGCEGCFYNDEISIGEYVRTKHYGITKIVPDGRYVKIDGDKNRRMYYVEKGGIPCEWEFGYYIWSDDIVKHSKDIIDLVQKDDYVNGVRILDITGDYIHTAEWDCCKERLRKKLKSIVTKEQIKQIEFRIGD